MKVEGFPIWKLFFLIHSKFTDYFSPSPPPCPHPQPQAQVGLPSSQKDSYTNNLSNQNLFQINMCFLLRTKRILPFSLADSISLSFPTPPTFSTGRLLRSLLSSKSWFHDFRKTSQDISHESMMSNHFLFQLHGWNESNVAPSRCWFNMIFKTTPLLFVNRLIQNLTLKVKHLYHTTKFPLISNSNARALNLSQLYLKI